MGDPTRLVPTEHVWNKYSLRESIQLKSVNLLIALDCAQSESELHLLGVFRVGGSWRHASQVCCDKNPYKGEETTLSFRNTEIELLPQSFFNGWYFVNFSSILKLRKQNQSYRVLWIQDYLGLGQSVMYPTILYCYIPLSKLTASALPRLSPIDLLGSPRLLSSEKSVNFLTNPFFLLHIKRRS